MNKTTRRRVGPVRRDDHAKRRWTEDLHLGGDLADLLVFNAYNKTQDGRTWIEKHQNEGVNLMRHAASVCLTKQDLDAGCEWSPEKFIHDQVDPEELLRLANRIYAEAQAFEVVKAAGGIW